MQDDMQKRFVSIWFPHLCTDWFANRRPELRLQPFVLSAPVHGRMMVTAANQPARSKGVSPGMTVADARAFIPSLQVLDEQPGLPVKLLRKMAAWCIRFTPVAAIDPPDGLILEATGCAHLWRGEAPYLQEIQNRWQQMGYATRAAMADTIGAAWAIARFGTASPIIAPGTQQQALRDLPAAALRIDEATAERLYKLGLLTIGSFMGMQRSALRRRFGEALLLRIDQALGKEDEWIEPIQVPEPYSERCPCMDPVVTRPGIEKVLDTLLTQLCNRLQKEGKGLRKATLHCHRVDGHHQQVHIGTHQASNNSNHLFKLFELHLDTIEPALGIELFVLDAMHVQEAAPPQETFWKNTGSISDPEIGQLLDRLTGKTNDISVQRFVPDEHYWPERSYRHAQSLQETPVTYWRNDQQRPIHVLPRPQPIRVTAPVPDYPPMLFTYQGVLHKVVKADGPERIEREWWIEGAGLHRDYYCVEDEKGKRYWIFRLGHYTGQQLPQWFIHGYFA